MTGQSGGVKYLTEGFYTFDMLSNTTVVEQTATLKLYKVPYYKGLPLAGGVRIAQIKSPSTLRKYQYMNDNWKSSGIQIRNPLYAAMMFHLQILVIIMWLVVRLY